MKNTIICTSFFVVLVSGCGKMIPHYKIDIEQGNVLNKELVNRIRPGMTKKQVRYILGTPVIVDTFHKNRWDYVYTYRKGGKKKIDKKTLSLFFENDKVVRLEGTLKPEFNDAPIKEESTRIVDVDPKKKPNKGIIKKVLNKVGIGESDPKADTTKEE